MEEWITKPRNQLLNWAEQTPALNAPHPNRHKTKERDERNVRRCMDCENRGHGEAQAKGETWAPPNMLDG